MKHASTTKTLLGFVRAFFSRRVPFLKQSESLDGIYNYLLIDDLFATSGQPSERQFELIKDAGYETVINLAPSSIIENSVVDESNLLTRLNLRYIHIPVDFKRPTEEDFQAFVEVLDKFASRKIWIHCAANMRVSAFVYRYRRQVLGESGATALDDLHRIWEPVGVWKTFVEPGS